MSGAECPVGLIPRSDSHATVNDGNGPNPLKYWVLAAVARDVLVNCHVRLDRSARTESVEDAEVSWHHV